MLFWGKLRLSSLRAPCHKPVRVRIEQKYKRLEHQENLPDLVGSLLH